jgi:hypothetical protein
MGPALQPALSLNREEIAILAELLESEHARLLLEIHHTDHRSFREQLRQRLNAIEALLTRIQMY